MIRNVLFILAMTGIAFAGEVREDTGGETRVSELEGTDKVADAVRVVGRDGVHAAGDRRVDRVGGVDGPGADFQTPLLP